MNDKNNINEEVEKITSSYKSGNIDQAINENSLAYLYSLISYNNFL